ncbi:AAA family ATPase [Gordonia zhaorongruii]|uniref:AAA family ATPase n=1 Tax=Gordonia zhaorongruii TaxID=2597659 RepID=UPI001046491C|nr:AAA family ATPase [Gordonia zhaorongruii]
MRLHRLRVANFRGITEREVVFAERGVTVIEGENEAGKSSMVEALDLLLTTRANSSKQQVRAVQPSGRDVGSEVFAEISCGTWRFEYFKRFNKATETALTILEPNPEQITGRPAHERVEEILGESLDRTLYRALRLLQSTDPELGDLTDSSALSRALDRAAGQVESESSAESQETNDLVAAVTTEYQRYYTSAQGRATGELAKAQQAAAAARAAATERETLLSSVQEATDRLPAVAAAIAESAALESSQRIDLATAAAEVSQAEAVGEQVKAARAVVAQREMAKRVAADAVRAREGLRTRLGQHESDAVSTASSVEKSRTAVREAEEKAEALSVELVASQQNLTALRERIEAAEAAETIAADRRRLTELDATLTEVRRLHDELAAARAATTGPDVTARDTARAAELDRDLAAARARLDAGAASVVVTPLGDEVVLDGQPVREEQTVSAATSTTVEVPGAVRVHVTPGADARGLADEVRRLTTAAAELTARCGVDDLSEVAGVVSRRMDAERTAAELQRSITRELGGRDLDELAATRAGLAERMPSGSGTDSTDDVVPASSVLRAQERDLVDLTARAERARDAEAARRRAAQERAEILEESARKSHHTAAALKGEIAEAVAETPDDALSAAVADADAELEEAQAAAAKLASDARGLDLAGLRARSADAEAALDRTRAQLADTRKLQTELSTRLEVCRSDGRLDELSDAVAELEAAEAHLRRVSERAAGARVLHETLQRKRSESRARYIDPFARRLEELASPVFGDGVRFEIGDDFQIATRTLDGVTVDVSALSGGAREQLGLLARLACASLVDVADGVPVILDDALGYTDPKRLTSMARVLSTSAGDAQIIVLTCTPDRYRDVRDATLIAV